MPIKRLQYFDQQFLMEPDFTDEQTYHVEMRRRLTRLLHTPGIADADGMGVVKKGDRLITVKAGAAIDRAGREIVLDTDQDLNLSDTKIFPATMFPPNGPVVVSISYKETLDDPTDGAPKSSRVTESAAVNAGASDPTDGSVVLARFTLDATGNVPGKPGDPVGTEARRLASAKLAPSSVSARELADGAVTVKALATGAVTQSALAPGSVTPSALAAGAVTQSALAPGAVTQGALSQGAVAESNLDPALANKITSPAAIAALQAAQKRVDSVLHIYGVVNGLTVVKSDARGEQAVTVQPGRAMDNAGNEIVLSAATDAFTPLGNPLWVTIAHRQGLAPLVDVVKAPPPAGSPAIVLARFGMDVKTDGRSTSWRVPGKPGDPLGTALKPTVTVTGDISITGGLGTPMWKVTQLFNDHPGPLPLAIDQFSTSGGTLLIFASGSGWGGEETNIGMDIYIDGVLRGKAGAYANLGGKHMTFSANALVVTGLLASQKHNLDLEPWTGTTSDGNDHYSVTVLELPF